MSIFQVEQQLPKIQPPTLFEIGTLPVTNAMFSGIVISLIFIVAVVYLSTKLTSQKTPSGFQVISELTIEKFQALIQQITGDKKLTEKLLPLVGTILLYFGLGNIITLFPGLNALTYTDTSMFRGPTNDFNTVFSVAVGIGVLSQIGSIKKFGFFKHIGKYIKIKEVYKGFKQGVGEGFLGIIEFFIGILDIVSEFAKIISLAVRIFGNMLAGLTLLTVLWGAFALVVPTAWMAMSLLFGIIHALVFGALSAAYYTLAVSTEQV